MKTGIGENGGAEVVGSGGKGRCRWRWSTSVLAELNANQGADEVIRLMDRGAAASRVPHDWTCFGNGASRESGRLRPVLRKAFPGRRPSSGPAATSSSPVTKPPSGAFEPAKTVVGARTRRASPKTYLVWVQKGRKGVHRS